MNLNSCMNYAHFRKSGHKCRRNDGKPICKKNCIDTECIIKGEKLTDEEINHAQNF